MAKQAEPTHFYLNEQHELSRGERESGGRLPKLGQIDWTKKQHQLSKALEHTKRVIDQSGDPLKGQRYFLLAKPESSVPKTTDNKRKAKHGQYDEPIDYAGKDSRVLGRLGLDVLSVTELGAVVHATPERLGRLTSIASKLSDLGRSEQARWASVKDFQPVPEDARADKSWLKSIGTTGRHEAVIELQPMLSRAESSIVLSTIAEKLQVRDGESILGSGADFSGRNWVRATLSPRAILEIVRNYFSVQAVHPPLLSAFAAVRSPGRAAPATATHDSRPSPDTLPVVGVVDTGVAKRHPILEQYRRGIFVHPQSAGVFDNHGTFVTSRIVFGDPSSSGRASSSMPGCRFVDVVVAQDDNHVDDKVVVSAIETVAANYPDARSFNLSFGDYTAVGLHQPVERIERLLLTQDLDNLIFAKDLLVVVAAGNSVQGVVPKYDYPDHWQDPQWGLGHWAAGFNTVKCGSYVQDWTIAGGLADIPYSPSPFCKVGPGLAMSPAPDFSAHGGNCTANYAWAPSLGVYGLTTSGLWEDRLGTSYAAPLLTRECAFALRTLQNVCPSESQPFAATVKALFALTADRRDLPAKYEKAARRTLGYGTASNRPLQEPSPEEAIFVWQGVLTNRTDVARVLVPIPSSWLSSAGDPTCDVATAWDTPVNAAFPNIYGCRRIDLKLRPSPDGDAVRSSRGIHKSYPLRVRTYELKPAHKKGIASDDLWLIELSYEEVCDYPATQTFTPEQRVSIAVRLKDRTGRASPQQEVQGLPIAATMTRLSVTPIPMRVPVTLRVT